MKKSMLVMMIWVILTLVDVHANDLGTTLNDPLEFHITKIKFIDCLYLHLRGIMKLAKNINILMFNYYMEEKKLLVNHQVVEVASKCMISCHNKRDENLFHLEFHVSLSL